MGNIKSQVCKHVFDILEANPDGVRYSELRRKILERGNYKANSVHGIIRKLHETYPTEIYRPEKGLYRLLKFADGDIPVNKNESVKKTTTKEHKFYQLFADYIVDELSECTKAISLGGSISKDKWGTPDVIGIRQIKLSATLFPIEIITAEIKADTNNLITAFGQAVAYRLFSHKSYIVIPKESRADDISRLDSLCRQTGIGLVLFNSSNDQNPDFEIRSRAIKSEPDMFYVDKYLRNKKIEKELL